jgi:isocitrate dehydrogenase kinase/phosphatase
MHSLAVLARVGAGAILRRYEDHRAAFQKITARARRRFETRDWAGGQRDAAERLALYRTAVDGVERELGELLGEQLRFESLWRWMKGLFAEFVEQFPDGEIAGTFFNSVTRRVFGTIGIDPEIEFVNLDLRREHYGASSTIHRNHTRTGSTLALVRAALAPHAFEAPWRDREGDLERAAACIDTAWPGEHGALESLDLLAPVFFRGSGAYLVGRLRGREKSLPLVFVLLHGERGLELDAVLTSEREVSILFSFTRAHFFVSVERPSEMIVFLHSLMPKKPLPELYIALGHSKHGKTEMYQELAGHLNHSMGSFDLSRGQPGMVMIVFDLRSYDYVFKLIRDRFGAPKKNDRAHVLDRYRLVFEHDRAGRLIEAQEFDHLTFERRRFSTRLLEELATAAAGSVTIDDELVHIHHVYVERRVQPLDLFLREAAPADAARIVLDWGQAIRDLASTNIFPGDFLLKNFGVTRHGRVTFYDYDEITLVTECVFLDLPSARDDGEELAAEPWFFVGEHDVFPEEFRNFLGLTGELRELFLAHHGELMTAAWWRALQERLRAGEVLDVLPYASARHAG